MRFVVTLDSDDDSSIVLGEINADSWQDAGRELKLRCINNKNLRDDWGFFVLPGKQPEGMEYIKIVPAHTITSLHDLVKEIVDATNDNAWLKEFNSQFN